MEKVTLTLETVTPLFLGGAEPRGEPELRPPAFRGALRYWLRAAAGGVIGDNDLKALHLIEKTVFGDTETGSPIGIRIPQVAVPPSRPAPILPHKAQGGVRRAFEAGRRFTFVLTARGGTHSLVWAAALSVLEMTVTLGGVGLRSRRGYGTLRVASAPPEYAEMVLPKDAAHWPAHINRVVSRAIQSVGKVALQLGVGPQSSLSANPPQFPSASMLSDIWLTQPLAGTAMEAVIAFMRRVPQEKYLGGISPRQASPLWVRPIEMGVGSYGLLFTVVASRLRVGTDYPKLQKFVSTFGVTRLSVKGWNA